MTASERRTKHSLEAMHARIKRAHELKGELSALAAQRQTLAREQESADAPALGRQQRRAGEQRRRQLEARELRLLVRDDEWVRATLAATRRMNGIMPADSATQGDELLWLLADELKLLLALSELRAPSTYLDEKTGEQIARRTMYEPLLLNVLGVLSRLVGAASGPQMRGALLADERWMTLLGFNMQEVQHGSTHRSEALAGKSREKRSGKFVDAGTLGPAQAREEGPRGVLSAQTLEGHESSLPAAKLMEFFNAVVKAMAARGYFAKRVRTVIDSTGAEVVPSFEGAGVVRKKVKVKSKARRPRALEVHVRGFKVWYVMEVETGLPLAMTLAPIETAEVVPVKALVEQAEKNLAGSSRMVSMALDRGFLDGDLWWWLREDKQIDWVCPSKEKMAVTEEARAKVAAAVSALGKPDETALQTAQRAAREELSHEGVRFGARVVAEGRAPLVVAQVEELKCTDFYGEGGSSSSRVHSKAFEPTALHATVVLSWPDRGRHDEEDERANDETNKGPLVLLSADKQAGLLRFARYDERSLIENRVNRDGKQYFGLGSALGRNEKAMWSGAVFSTVALMLYRALELEQARATQDLDRRSKPLGILRYRRQRSLQRRGWIIVVIDERYGLMPLREFARDSRLRGLLICVWRSPAPNAQAAHVAT